MSIYVFAFKSEHVFLCVLMTWDNWFISEICVIWAAAARFKKCCEQIDQ